MSKEPLSDVKRTREKPVSKTYKISRNHKSTRTTKFKVEKRTHHPEADTETSINRCLLIPITTVKKGGKLLSMYFQKYVKLTMYILKSKFSDFCLQDY